MGALFRALWCVLLPPLAVADKGCGVLLIVSFLTLMGWFPGVFAALYFAFVKQPRYVTVPVYDDAATPQYDDYPAKRKREYIELADGAVAEVVDDEEAPPNAFFDDQESQRRSR